MATSEAYSWWSRTGRCQSEQKTGVAEGSGAIEVGDAGSGLLAPIPAIAVARPA
ncbi:hypothetical protein [Streptomyces adelaidensis]|uniref:hypothetical protein n=1 Tax=Streptomyces adelaidensis TaxID=2796465 RepID=UPI0035564849